MTISFLTLASALVWHVFNMSKLGSGGLKNGVTTNPYVCGALLVCVGLLAAAVYLLLLSGVLEMADPGLSGWLLVLLMSLAPLAVGQIVKGFSLGEI